MRVGDLVELTPEAGRTTSYGDAGIIVKIHMAHAYSAERHTFYWVQWNGEDRPLIHFAHELKVLQGKENKDERSD